VRSISLSPLPAEAAAVPFDDGAPYPDPGNDQIVVARDFGFADGASASHLPALDAPLIHLQPELAGDAALAPLGEAHTDEIRHQTRPRRMRTDVRRSRGR